MGSDAFYRAASIERSVMAVQESSWTMEKSLSTSGVPGNTDASKPSGERLQGFNNAAPVRLYIILYNIYKMYLFHRWFLFI